MLSSTNSHAYVTYNRDFLPLYISVYVYINLHKSINHLENICSLIITHQFYLKGQSPIFFVLFCFVVLCF